MSDSNNTALWDAVFRTDPKATKPFKRAGGFGGTAIDPMYLIHKATKTFGPIGIGWGFEEIEHRIEAGVWFSKVRVWYIWNGQRGQVEQWGATVLEGTNKHGNFVDEEAAKKSITDALTKAMSYIGFAADVHLGLFDDSKYVAMVGQEIAHEQRASHTTNGSAKPTSGQNPKTSPVSEEYAAFSTRVQKLMEKHGIVWKSKTEVKDWVLADQDWLRSIGIESPPNTPITWEHVQQCRNTATLATIYRGIEEETLNRSQGREQGEIK